MALQKTFKKKYANQLQYEAIHGINIDRYSKPEFEYDKEQVLLILQKQEVWTQRLK